MARCFQQRGLSEDFLWKNIKIKNIISTRLELAYYNQYIIINIIITISILCIFSGL